MATAGIGVDKVAQQARTTNEDEVGQEAGTANKDDEVGQEAGTADEINDTDGDAFREDTREHQDRTVQVQNQDKSGYLMSLVGKTVTWTVDKFRWRSPPVSQCQYIDGDPSVTAYKVICNEVITGSTEAQYKFKFHDPPYIITGISCLPIDTKTSSPEADVISGGVGFKEVEIVLTPVRKGDWYCCVQIVGIEENCLEINSAPDSFTM